VESANERQKLVLIDKAVEYYDGDISGKTFGVWGLAFKPGTDDMREAPSRTIIKELVERGAYIYAYDPVATDEAKRAFTLDLSAADMRRIHFCETLNQALVNVDALFIITDWKEFKTPNFRDFHESMNSPVIFDGRNLFDPNLMYEEGIIYKPIGR